MDFDYCQITVHDGKGKKDRVTPLAKKVIPILQAHITQRKMTHKQDLIDGFGGVYLPNALVKKYPNADRNKRVASPLFLFA